MSGICDLLMFNMFQPIFPIVLLKLQNQKGTLHQGKSNILKLFSALKL